MRLVHLGDALFVASLFSFVLFLGMRSAKHRFPTVDETAHLPSGVAHWEFGTFEMYRVNPPLMRLVCTVFSHRGLSEAFDWAHLDAEITGRPEFSIGVAALQRFRVNYQALFVKPFLVSLLVFLIGPLVTFLWIREVLGFIPAAIASALWASSPSMLANVASLIPDVAMVSCMMLCFYFSYRYCCKPTLLRCVCAGVSLGFALSTKLTCILLLVMVPFLLIFLLTAIRRARRSRPGLKVVAKGISLYILLAVTVLNACYLFGGSLSSFGGYEFCSETLGGPGCNQQLRGNRFSGGFLASLPVPLPKDYVLGIDYLRMEVECKKWSFLNGEWRYGGTAFYYCLSTLYKTPETTLIAAALGFFTFVIGVVRGRVDYFSVNLILLITIPAAVCFASVSLQGGFNHHHRYVLMIYPGMFVLAAYVASPVGVQLLRLRLPFIGPKKRSIAIPLAITLVTLSAASSLRVHPYYTSYFNTLSGGPENGWRLLGFSNIDWGQDILEVDKWLKENPEKRPLVMDLDYFGMNGELFDVPTSDPPQLPRDASIDEVRGSLSETQWWIISVKKLYNRPGHDGLEYLQQIEPIDRIAYAYHVYRIDPLRSSEPPTSPADAQ